MVLEDLLDLHLEVLTALLLYYAILISSGRQTISLATASAYLLMPIWFFLAYSVMDQLIYLGFLLIFFRKVTVASAYQ